jgi:hypothetical protein
LLILKKHIFVISRKGVELVCHLMLLLKHSNIHIITVAYLKDPWNQLDFFIVISNVISYVFISVGGAFSNFRALRGFRALRPLRALKKAPELRMIVDVIANCLPVFLNLIFCAAVFGAVAGVLMMNLFSVRYYCLFVCVCEFDCFI